MTKKLPFFAIFLCMASAALGEVTARICLPDGSTLGEPAEVMVGTQLSIVVASDDDEVWIGDLLLEDANSDYAVLYGRDYNDEPEGPFPYSYEGSCLPAAGFGKGVMDVETTSIDGLQLLTGLLLIARDDWFVVDYNVINTGDCKVVFNGYDPTGPEPLYGDLPPPGQEPIVVEHRYIEFTHVRTRDFNVDGYVDFGDFAVFSSYWRDTGYSDPCQCEGTDLDANGNIDVNDLMLFCGYWLEETDKRWWPVPVASRDFNNDGYVNLGDFAVLASYWRETGYSDPNQCEGTDLDADGDIDENDLRLFNDYWYGPTDWWWP
ncbi:MAG: dockerin type I domain-containing protein [Planctomycetota bacterium]|jgi:hypothetical protein